MCRQTLPDSGFEEPQRIGDPHIGLVSMDPMEDIMLVTDKKTEVITSQTGTIPDCVLTFRALCDHGMDVICVCWGRCYRYARPTGRNVNEVNCPLHSRITYLSIRHCHSTNRYPAYQPVRLVFRKVLW